jgi:CTP:molybdopterin cytidylyltransferase MocA
VAGVLLAAGEGSRFGRPKALVELDGLTLAERGVALLRTGGADPVLVVAGAASVELPGVHVVYNEQWRTGMGSSLRAALQALGTPPGGFPFAADVGAVVVALADQPLVGAGAVARLIAAYQAGASVAVAAYEGKPRNPVLLARQHWPDVIAMAAGDTGARAFLHARPDLVTLVECGDTGRPDDIDTQGDLARIAERLGAQLLFSYSSANAWMPHVCVTLSPGSSTSRSSPVMNAFGGHVMGSTASALRRCAGCSTSPVKTCSQR